MSYDLFIYRRTGQGPSEDAIRTYLSSKLVAPNEPETQWFFTNPDTDVYYFFEFTPAGDEPEDSEDMVPYEGFEHTGFAFNLNFIRPNFFGLEAFAFVEAFLKDLDLYAVNPQGSAEGPIRESGQALFDNWSATNRQVSGDYFAKTGGLYMPEDKATAAWRFNYHRRRLQQEVGEAYFVPQLLFLQRGTDVVTLAIWPEHLPLVFPDADYYLLARKVRRWFKTVEEAPVISRATLLRHFGPLLKPHSFEGCLILHPDEAEKARSRFNAVPAEEEPGFATRLAVDHILHVRK